MSSARRSPRPRGAPRDSLPQYSSWCCGSIAPASAARTRRITGLRTARGAPGHEGAPCRARRATVPRRRWFPACRATPHRPEVVPAAKQAHGPYARPAAMSPCRPYPRRTTPQQAAPRRQHQPRRAEQRQPTAAAYWSAHLACPTTMALATPGRVPSTTGYRCDTSLTRRPSGPQG